MLKRRSEIKGFQDGGMNVDPVSGNEVPTGSLPEEVRDDVDAKLSPGEFVIPADVVRFIGLERLMKMRDEAKKGIQRMSEIGQMGNADEVGEESNSTYEDDEFESEIDDILGEVENENGVDDQTKMAFGGYVGSGTDLTKAPKNPVFDVRYYKNKEGATMFITHINGKPMTPVPEGFTQVSAEEAQKVGKAAEEEEAKKKKPTQDDYGYSDTPQLGRDLTEAEAAKRDEQLAKANAFLTKAVPFVVPGVALAQKAATLLKGKEQPPAPVEQRTGVSAAAIQAQDLAFSMGLSTENAAKAAKAAEEAAKSGVDTNKAASDAVFAIAMEQQSRGIAEELEALNASTSTTPSTSSSSRGMTSAGSSFAVSPPSVAATAPVRGSTIETRDLDTSVDSGYVSPEAIGQDVGESYSFLAKGGLVNKRQYPTKKKKGKGIATSK